MSRHIKRLNLPKCWKLPRKQQVFAPKVSPGKHPLDASIPLVVILRDVLGVANTANEAKRIINTRKVLVDQKTVTDPKTPVGLMDTVSLPDENLHYRVLIDKKGRIVLEAIPAGEATWKLVQVKRKTLQKGGVLQVGTHDGRNILVAEDKFKVLDTLQIELPSQRILKHYSMKTGHKTIVTGGTHTGSMATLMDINRVNSPKPNTVKVEEGYETLLDYIFIIGDEEPVIKVHEEGMT